MTAEQSTSNTAASEVTPERARQALIELRMEIGKAVVGQDTAVTALVLALLCRGHVLLEGVPGTCETLLVRTLAPFQCSRHRRIQFTPDLMPSDVMGTSVFIPIPTSSR